MFEHQIDYGQRSFDITALELYLKLHQQKDVWWDPATDKDAAANEQFKRGTWYVRQKKGAAYWRLDITAGDISSGVQAGLLIAQLDHDGGSGKAFHAVVRGKFGRQGWTTEERQRIDQIHGKRVDGSDGSPLRLVKRAAAGDRRFRVGIRKGIPKNDARNFEEIVIRDAHLRISTLKS